MALTAEQIKEQQKQAEELLFAGPQVLGFAKSLFFGRLRSEMIFPFPQIKADEIAKVEQAKTALRQFADEKIDPVAIDRNADIPREVIDGLAEVGVFGMTAPEEIGGHGLSQQAYCQILEILGGRCASTSIFVNVQHSIGMRGLLLFGTAEQKREWLPDLIAGRKLAAFALTEAKAGSDAANVQTTATPSADGQSYILNGEKRYITSGGIAQVLTVMARTPVEGSDKTAITAFLVTPDLPGFEVVEERMDKCGIRGTATGRLAFHDMPVPKANILGKIGKGLRLALTVLDFGRTTFGACCTGAAKTCLEASIKHAKQRVQFQQPIGEFELIKKKIAYMAAQAFAMEATTQHVASVIDSGFDDYMLETAMLKVFSTEALWLIVNDTMQIYGGQGYFTDEPFERMMRDARINQIGEGANEVLLSFIALVGMRGVGEHLQEVLSSIKHPIKKWGTLWGFTKNQVASSWTTPNVPVQHASLRKSAKTLGRDVRDFGKAVQTLLRKYREAVLERQYLQERIAWAGCYLYAGSCVLSRLDHLLQNGNSDVEKTRLIESGYYFLALAHRVVHRNLAELWDNDDALTTRTADAYLKV